MDGRARSFGSELRRRRTQRGFTQMALAHAAEVSTRHLSWLETGRSEPSRAMLLRLAQCLEVPLRERNALLVLAGFAPLYAERTWQDDTGQDQTLAALREQVQALLDAHLPWPALAVDRHWHMVAANAAVHTLLQAVPAALRETAPLNVLRLSLHEDGMASMIENLPQWRAHVLQRLHRQWAASGDAVLGDLLAEFAQPHRREDEVSRAADVAQTLVLKSPWGRLRFLTTVTRFGAPHEVLLDELAVETLLPADAATAEILRGLATQTSPTS